ncbi:hypothetical protein CJU89_4278 [Yarrowia sp. B02]|nr:hypothetical protein CJU89_4278 [Yarrowia sp. B02]
MADKKGKQVESGQTPMDNSDTDYDVLSISSRCVSSDDNDLKGSWYGVGQLDEDTDDPESLTFMTHEDVDAGSSPPLSPQSLKMPTLAFSIDSLSESTPTPSKYFFKDDLKLEWDVVAHKTARNPPRYRDGHNLPPLGAPVDRVCLLNLCGTPAHGVQKFFVHYYGFKTEVEMLNLANIDKLEFNPSTSYVGFITLTSEESISSALVKIDAALNARARGIYVTCWAPSQLSTTSLINTSVFAALKPLQDTTVLSFPLALDTFDPLDIQLIEWEEHSVRRKRSSTFMFQFDQRTVWKAIIGFLILAISAQISQYFLLYSIGDVNIVAPKIAPAMSTSGKSAVASLGTTSSARFIPKLLTKKCCMEKARRSSVIIVPPSPLETNPTGFQHCVMKQPQVEQQRLLPSPDKPTIDEEKKKSKSWVNVDIQGVKNSVWRTVKRAQRHKLVKLSEYRVFNLDVCSESDIGFRGRCCAPCV